TTDNAFPFNIYAAQQDNSSVRIAHRSDDGAITERHWESTAGGESATIAVDPLNNDIVYGGEYHGLLTRVDHKNKTNRAINVWPEDNMGHGAEDARFRFQWNYPVFFSPHDPHKLYVASNHLHVSTNEGQSWTTVSPDLTTNDKNRQKSSGGPITKDNTGVEYYCTIFTAAESPRVKDLLWTGSDDGLVHVSRDGGKNWSNVTPPAMPAWTMINSLEPDPHNDGGCYLACTAYKLGDYRPFLYKTKDYGKTWIKITDGIPKDHFTRVIRADRTVQGILYAGTEQGMYISFDDGANWQSFQLNLPVVPITDLVIKDNHLLAATQGRSIWSVDDLSVLQQLVTRSPDSASPFLFKPAPAFRMRGGSSKGSKLAGENHPNGMLIHFVLPAKPSEKDTVTLAVLENDGDTIRVFSSVFNKSGASPMKPMFAPLSDLKAGANLFVWNMRYPDAEKFDGMILWSYDLEGTKAVPGKYKVRLTASGKTVEESFEIVRDPRTGVSDDHFMAQFSFVQSVGTKLTEAHRAIREIRSARTKLQSLKGEVADVDRYKEIVSLISAIDSSMTKVEEALYQTKNRSSQDPLNYPVRLNDKLANLMGLNVGGDFPPTSQSLEVRDYLFKLTDEQLNIWKTLKLQDIPRLNQLIRTSGVDFINIK
ncbi:MAG: hypothetical protein RLZ62_1985, partial [Bacteroidota bacterium]